jgi:hypothetical protein
MIQLILRRAAALLLFCVVARATTVIPPTFPELVAEAETIVRGTVVAVRSEEFDSPQGRAIRSFVTLRVERMLKGTPAPTVVLNILGGTQAGRTLRIPGVPEFRVGDRQIVFIADNGRVFCPLIALGHGRYHVRVDATTGREFIARDNGVPMHSTDEIPLPLRVPVAAQIRSVNGALAPAEFEAQIARAVRQPPQAARP